MNYRQQAVNMGAHDEPMGLLDDIIASFQADVRFYSSTDNPMYGLFVARTTRALEDLGIKLNKYGIRHASVLNSRQDITEMVRLLSAGSIDCILMPTMLACAGGFRLPVKRLTVVSLDPMTPSMAIQLLSRAHREAQVRSLVWLKQEPNHNEPAKKPYPNMRVTFNDTLTEIQQDSIVSVLIALGCVETVDLGTSEYGMFHASETITKDASNKVHHALTNQPDEDRS